MPHHFLLPHPADSPTVIGIKLAIFALAAIVLTTLACGLGRKL